MSFESENETATLLSQPPTILHAGHTLNGRYQIDKELKRGGFGVVYLAHDLQLHSRPVVIKVLLEEAFQNQYVVQKFRQEIEALSRIDHPGVVGIIECGKLSDDKPFIVMQYVDGSTLRSVFRPQGMDFQQSADLLRQIGRALTAAHDKGIFHRDLKPENIMLQNLGHGEVQVKIIDFGIAKIKDSVVAPVTATNVSVGTVSYMAPEQLSGMAVSAATDVYALGQIAYEMLTGRKAFNPNTGFQLLEMQRAGVRVSPVDLRPALPLRAKEIMLRALSFDADKRQQTARDFGDELANALKSESIIRESFASQTTDPLPTQLATEQTPLARRPQVVPEKTIAATFPINPAAIESGDGLDRGPVAGSRRLFFIGMSSLALIVAVAGWYLFAHENKQSPASHTTVTVRQLSYALTVQKMRDGRPYQEPFESSGQEIFENGWKFAVSISSPETGYLYLLNEGPAADGTTTLNVLFPAPSTNSGASYVSANQEMKTGWMTFDENQGTEKFWLVWATTSIPELEALKGAVNETDKGTIKDQAQAKALADFLSSSYAQSKPEVEKDTTKKKTNLRGKGDVVVSFIELEHH